ncbi:HD domain-containing protein [Carbonactinospora thermoautotrophica]|uniref:Metal dependent phosphohydrolase n=2 Tax=Carbonactinospora thermoautotrophica TaxID=1469144 RepID=A0A132MNT3_9ACTN|nr:HD domain-containing phosphohydrolase [Carbonactinospora thermoautotrophica]KWW99379.1 Metal dependent phosphohydrolase [Carbonactinospora thermoautotrophica]MCX9192498.1 HD domain-containing protein [Carbonactinospora thermoautotrophica]
MTQPLRFEDANARISGMLVLAAAVLAAAALVVTAVQGIRQPGYALAFGALIAFGELIRIVLPGDREAAPLSSAGALAYALLLVVGDHVATHGALQVVALTACGILLGALPHMAVGRAPLLDYVARRLLVVGAAAVLFRPLYLAHRLPAFDTRPILLALFMGLVVSVAAVIDAALAALVRVGRDRTPFGAALRNEARALLGIVSAISATGMLIALAANIMGLWALVILSVPLVLTQFSFRRYAAIRATYLQTIRALARVTEIGGYTESGHARRVSQLATAVGRELGMSEPELLDLEYAALMHDVGQLSLADPIPGGATVIVSPEEQKRIARLGAEIIRQTGVLDNVATIVERQAEPYRRPQQPDPAVPLASRIIKAVNAYDDLVGGSLDPTRRAEALERLRLGTASEYDPRVVDSLSRVVERLARA